MPERKYPTVAEAEKQFAQLMPGYDIKKAKRTKLGYPYVLEQGEFEPGTFGLRMNGLPKVRLSKKAKPEDELHEARHVEQFYAGGIDSFNEGFNPRSLVVKALAAGLTPEDADWYGYASEPAEVDARQAAGQIEPRYEEIVRKIAEIEAKRKARSGAASQYRAFGGR